MDRLSGLRGCEAPLKALLDRLVRAKGRGLSARTERAYLRMLLRARLVAIRSSIDGIARGLSGFDREEFAWQVRMGLPFFCHLESVLSLVDEGALEVSAA
jgi:hypothetical protein